MYWTVTMTDGRTETREGSEADATRWSSEPGVAHVVLIPDREVGDRGGDRLEDRTPPPGGEGQEPSEGGKGKDKGKHKGHDEP